MSHDRLVAYNLYAAAWNTPDAAKATDLLAQCWAANGAFFDPENPSGLIGVEPLVRYILASHADMPGLDITSPQPPEDLGGRLRLSWVARQGPTVMFTGTDFVEFAADGRISQLTMFYDSTPD